MKTLFWTFSLCVLSLLFHLQCGQTLRKKRFDCNPIEINNDSSTKAPSKCLWDSAAHVECCDTLNDCYEIGEIRSVCDTEYCKCLHGIAGNVSSKPLAQECQIKSLGVCKRVVQEIRDWTKEL